MKYYPLQTDLEYYLYGWILFDDDTIDIDTDHFNELRQAIHDYIFRGVVDNNIPKFKETCDEAIESYLKLTEGSRLLNGH